MVRSILSGKDSILSPGKSWVFLPGKQGCLLTVKVEKYGFTRQRRSVVDPKQAWKEAGPHRVLHCLAVSLHFIGH